MNNTNDLYNRWLAQPDLDDAVKAELVSIAGDSDAVTDRFTAIWNSAPAACAA